MFAERVLLVFVFLTLSSPLQAGTHDGKGGSGDNPAREMGLGLLKDAVVPSLPTFDPSLRKLSDPVLTDVLTRFSQSVYLAANLLPEGNSLFHWGEDKSSLANKAVQIRLTTSDDPLFKQVAGAFGNDTDAATIVTKSKSTGKFVATVLILVDRMAKGPDGKERNREQIAARMNTAMAHELHGNVLSFLENTNPNPQLDERTRFSMEVRAFKAGIKYLQDLMATEGFKDLPETEKAAYDERLKNEQAGLAAWQKRLEDLNSRK